MATHITKLFQSIINFFGDNLEHTKTEILASKTIDNIIRELNIEYKHLKSNKIKMTRLQNNNEKDLSTVLKIVIHPAKFLL